MNLPITHIVSYVLVSLASLSVSYAQRISYAENIPVEKIRLIPELMRGGTVSEMLTDLEYIPLQEVNKQYLDRVMDMAVTEDRIAILSNQPYGRLYIYDMKGQLIKYIDKFPFTKTQFKKGTTVFRDIKAQGDHFVASHYPYSATYDKNGELIDTLTATIGSIRADEMVQFPDSVTYKYFSTFTTDDKPNPHILTRNNEPLVINNTADTNRTLLTFNNTFSPIHQGISYFTIPQKTLVFELNKQGIQKIYDFIFPLRNTLSTEDIIKHKSTDDFLEKMNKEDHKILEISYALPYKDYLLFYILKSPPELALYHLKSKEIIGLKYITPDKSNDFLDITHIDNVYIQGDYIYSVIYAYSVKNAKIKADEERHTVSKEFSIYEKSINPILVRFKLK